MKVMDPLNLLSVAETSVISMLQELSHRSRSTAVLRCEEVCARIDIVKIKRSKKMTKMMRYMGGRMVTVDFTHCKVKKMKSVKFEKKKKRRDIISLQNNEWAWESYTDLFISHSPLHFALCSTPPLSRSSKMCSALLPISIFPLISDSLHLISTFLLLYILFLII